MPHRPPRLAYAVSSHGFGHAARACAVIAALARRCPGLRVTVIGETPDWFFRDSLGHLAEQGLELGWRCIATDVGLCQTDALVEDPEATARALAGWWPAGPGGELAANRLAALCEALADADLAICDISPFALAAARRVAVPSLLVENFTWDWIYRGYGEDSHLAPWVEPLAELFAQAERRVQTMPCCQPLANTLAVPPVARQPRCERREVRRRLELGDDQPMVLVTMGGIEWDYGDLERRLGDPSLPWLVIPGGCAEPRRQGRCLRLPHHSSFYHPDLIHAADAVVGKLGYSTLAEVWSAGIPFGYVPRDRFPESPTLERWLVGHLPHRAIAAERLISGRWLEDLEPLLAQPAVGPASEDGAHTVAGVALEMLG